jgi:predicted AAA+ superfamily ATPase
MEDNYKKRIIDAELQEVLEIFGGILVEGPKWCGKTWTSEHHSNSSYYIADPKNNFQSKRLTIQDPELILRGETPRLIDEWQEVPQVWDAARFNIDHINKRGLYIFTGSSNPPLNATIHSGTGRFARIKMRPMTLTEMEIGSNEVSLENIVTSTEKIFGENKFDLGDIVEVCVRGGWPSNLSRSLSQAQRLNKEYVDSLVNTDISKYDGEKRDPEKMLAILESLARNNETLVTNQTILKDVGNISEPTLVNYLSVLKNLFMLDNIPAFSNNSRSKIKLRKNSKIRLVDPSLAISILGLTPKNLIDDLSTFGFMFESMVVRDILVYAEVAQFKVFHYRESSGKDEREYESDLIISLPDREYSLVEVKLGASVLEESEAHLLKLANRLERNGFGRPKTISIISGLSSYAYTTKNNVHIVPYYCLGK